VNSGSEFAGDSDRMAKSGIIKLSAICEVVDKVIGMNSVFILQ